MSKSAFAVIVLSLFSVGCQSLENTRAEVQVRELFAGNQCAATEAGLRLLEDKAEALTLTGTHRIGAQPAQWDIDHEQEWVLLVAAGRKPSAGYRLELTKHSASVHDGVLNLPVSLSTPAQDYQAMMITSPCLLLAVQRGPYRRIVTENLDLELELPEVY